MSSAGPGSSDPKAVADAGANANVDPDDESTPHPDFLHEKQSDNDATPANVPKNTEGAEQQREGDDMQALYALIERELTVRGQRNASWKQLDLCHKWRLIQEYLRDANCTPTQFADVRAMLRGNALLNVEYDGVRVTRLNAQDL